jgi:electron transport complex protein RnfG
MKNTLTLSTALAAVCLIASGILSVANKYTKPGRDKAELAEKSQALADVLPAYDNSPLKENIMVTTESGESVTFYLARKNGEIIAAAGQGVTDKGFGGRLELLVGLDPAGDILRVVITRHTETPGLGTVITDRKATKTLTDLLGDSETAAAEKQDAVPPNHWLDQYGKFNAVAHPDFQVNKDGGDIEAVSGATITSRAVADAVTRVAQAFKQHRQEIIGGEQEN